MRYITLVYIALFYIAVAAACTGDSLADADARAVVGAAISDADAVAAADAGSMQREKAVLAIRAKESQLRMNGYDLAADLYEQTACSLLVQQGILDPQCLSISPK